MVFKAGQPPPEGAGRKKGIANKLAEKYKELIEKSGPIEFLIKAYETGKVGEDVLTGKERCDIANGLAKKVSPDLKAVDHGDLGSNLTFVMQSAIAHAPNEKPVVTNGVKDCNEDT